MRGSIFSKIWVSSNLNYCKYLLMDVLNKNINNIFFIFALSHLIIWTLIPSLTNKNLPLDTIEALAWGSNLDWGFNKHPPFSAFAVEVFYQLFGNQDWACLLYTSPSPRDLSTSRMPSSA